MTDPAPRFTLRLGAGRTIGHLALREIWRQASCCPDVTVTRTFLDSQRSHSCVYTLSGARGIVDIAAVERRLRDLLVEEVVGGQVRLTRLG